MTSTPTTRTFVKIPDNVVLQKWIEKMAIENHGLDQELFLIKMQTAFYGDQFISGILYFMDLSNNHAMFSVSYSQLVYAQILNPKWSVKKNIRTLENMGLIKNTDFVVRSRWKYYDKKPVIIKCTFKMTAHAFINVLFHYKPTSLYTCCYILWTQFLPSYITYMEKSIAAINLRIEGYLQV